MSTTHIFWHDAEQTVICTEYSGAWTWDDFHATVDSAVSMMNTRPCRVDLIIAPHPNSVMPRGSAEPHFKRAIQVLPPNFGLQVIVSRSVLSRTIASIFVKLLSRESYHDRLFFVSSVDEAYQLILKDRAKQNVMKKSA